MKQARYIAASLHNMYFAKKRARPEPPPSRCDSPHEKLKAGVTFENVSEYVKLSMETELAKIILVALR